MSEIAVFDLDGTLLEGDCAQDWLVFLCEQKWPKAEVAFKACERLMGEYDAGQMDMEAYMLAWLGPLAGVHMDKIRPMRAEFVARWIKPRIFKQASRCLAEHKKRGDRMLIISASPSLLVAPIADLLDVDASIGIEISMSNEVVGNHALAPFSYREGKIACLNEWLELPAQEPGAKLPVSFYSDSQNDLALLKRVINPVAVNPDEHLERVAKEQSWKIEYWT